MSQYKKLSEEEIKLWKKAIDLALEKLINEGWNPKNNSKKFDVLYKGNRVPPKEVIAYVFDYFDANDIITSIYSVNGGDKDTNELLRDFGLDIVDKKISLKDLIKKIEVWYAWRDNYQNFVPRFIEEATKGLNYSEWDKDVFNEFFEKSNNQCVSSLRQGYYTHNEKDSIKENWKEIAPILKEISLSQNEPLFELYNTLRQVIRKYTKQDRRAATNRLIASIQPNILCTIVNHDNLNSLITFLNKFVLNADIKIKSDWFESSNAVHNFFIKEGGFDDHYEMITYPWQLFEYFKGNHHLNDNDMSEKKANNEILDLLKYKKQIILQGPPGTGKTRHAKIIAKEIIGCGNTDIDKQLKLIQFHPSYTYEDFVRGIVSKPNEEGEGIVYEAENKVFADFAKRALENYLLSINQNKNTPNKPVFDAFIDSIKEEIAQSELHKFNITDAVYLFSADETRFKYKGDNWVAHSKGLNMKFSELKRIIDSGATERQDIKKMSDIEELTRQHATYFIKLVEKYYEFEKSYEFEMPNTKQVELKNYVLIIDEINRANLSSVLGELIYALEYRGEAVESMYAVANDNKLILPPNLYIIGTMNTADRSVGHIDYAIRRRFSFVNMLPQDLASELKDDFELSKFSKVASLFVKDYKPELDYNDDATVIERSEHLTHDFDPKDVWLGHSYFIKQYEKDENGKNIEDKPIDFKLRIKYEIKPILEEYIKDGILKESARDIINSL